MRSFVSELFYREAKSDSVYIHVHVFIVSYNFIDMVCSSFFIVFQHNEILHATDFLAPN